MNPKKLCTTCKYRKLSTEKPVRLWYCWHTARLIIDYGEVEHCVNYERKPNADKTKRAKVTKELPDEGKPAGSELSDV
jgi:hypothetical protein